MSTVITVSREIGSQGSYIATKVAKKLELRYLDREILHQAAKIVAGYPDHNMVRVLEKEEQMPTLLSRIRASLAYLTSAPQIPSATMREHQIMEDLILTTMQERNLHYENAWNLVTEERFRTQVASRYARLVEQVIREFAQEGNAIIIGRGGQVILKDIPSTLHILIIAPEDIRIHRLSERMNIDSKEAKKRVLLGDKERARYLKRFHNAEWKEPSLYDITINTAKLSEDLAVKIIYDTALQLSRMA
jgi:cytidylate kinase